MRGAVIVAVLTFPPIVAGATTGHGETRSTSVDHVIAISVDGLNPRAIRVLGPERAPAFHRLIREGAWTLNARTVYEVTKTLPNHTSMVTGRRMRLPSGHGVDFNHDNGSTVHQAAGEYVDSVFSVVHDHGGTTALYAGKDKFRVLDRSWDDANGEPDLVGFDDGQDKIDVYQESDSDSVLVDAVVSQLSDSPIDFTLLHQRAPDTAGHTHGFMSAAYLDAVADTDANLGRVLDAIAGDPELLGRTAVLLTADHGGGGSTSHTARTRVVNYRIPLFAWGAAVQPGGNLYDLNPDRGHPGRTRPAYQAEPQPVRNAEIANLATDLLDLPAVPGSGINARQDLDLTSP